MGLGGVGNLERVSGSGALDHQEKATGQLILSDGGDAVDGELSEPALNAIVLLFDLRWRAKFQGTPLGELLFSLSGALAEYERALTRERTMAGLAAAKRRGRHGGRRPTM